MDSPRSVDSDLSGSPPRLDAATLSLLDSHFAERAEEERLFNDLAEQSANAHMDGLSFDDDEESEGIQSMLSVSQFRKAFGEDWQLSQFWYSDDYATKLARLLHRLCTPTSKIVFISCPTAFVAFQHEEHHPGAVLFEIDQRFAIIAPKQFVAFDLDKPDHFPESLKGSVDIVVADPPFLNEVTNVKLAKTVKGILRPTGKFILMTSTSVQEVLREIYDKPPLGPLRKTKIVVGHNQLQNDFACWGSWEEAENLSL